MDILEAFRWSQTRPAAAPAPGELTIWLSLPEASDTITARVGGVPVWSGRAAEVDRSEEWVRATLPVATLPLHATWSGEPLVVTAAGHPFPVAVVEPDRIWADLCDPHYAAWVRSNVPDNHWRVDYAFVADSTITLTGWAVRGAAAPAPTITVDGRTAAVIGRLPHPDPVVSHWFSPGSEQAGFVAVAAVDPAATSVRIDWRRDEAGPRATPRPQVVHFAPAAVAALPDDARIHRVSGPLSNTTTYLNEGLADTLSLTEIAAAAGVDAADPAARVVDWGCGPGRMTRHLVALPGGRQRVTGVDIDGDNVQWCRDHLPGRYLVAPLHPPLAEVESGSADLVLSHSVLTHLRREEAASWLAEIARWLAPGGLAVLTFNGDSSTMAMHSRQPARMREIVSAGIDDTRESHDLDGVVDPDYYRVTVGTDAAWRSLLGESFEVIDLLPAATSGFQTAAVLRRRDS